MTPLSCQMAAARRGFDGLAQRDPAFARQRALGLLARRVRRRPAVRARLLQAAERTLESCPKMAWFGGRVAHDLLCVERPCLGAGALRQCVEEQEAIDAVIEALAAPVRRLLGMGARARAARALRALDWDAYARRVETLDDPWAEVLSALRYTLDGHAARMGPPVPYQKGHPPCAAQRGLGAAYVPARGDHYGAGLVRTIAICQEAAVIEQGLEADHAVG